MLRPYNKCQCRFVTSLGVRHAVIADYRKLNVERCGPVTAREPAVYILLEPAVYILLEPAVYILLEPAVYILLEPTVYILLEPAVYILLEPAVYILQKHTILLES